MSKEHDYIAREIYQNQIRNGLLGPGSDIFVSENEVESEIISDYPLQRYYTGILFPEKTKIPSLNDLADAEIASETDENDEDENLTTNESTDEDKERNFNAKDENSDNELRISQNTFFPTNIGLTFCLSDDIKEINTEFSFGLYSQIEKELKIKIPKTAYNEFIENPAFPFKDIISFDNGYMILKRKLKGKSKAPRTEEFEKFDGFKKSDSYRDSTIKYVFHYFEKLIGRTWKREDFKISATVPVKDALKPEILFKKNVTKTKENFLKIGYTVKTNSVLNVLKNTKKRKRFFNSKYYF